MAEQVREMKSPSICDCLVSLDMTEILCGGTGSEADSTCISFIMLISFDSVVAQFLKNDTVKFHALEYVMA